MEISKRNIGQGSGKTLGLTKEALKGNKISRRFWDSGSQGRRKFSQEVKASERKGNLGEHSVGCGHGRRAGKECSSRKLDCTVKG